MRRRPPHLIKLPGADAVFLCDLLTDGRTEQRIARRARLLLAMSDPVTVVADLAAQYQQSRFAIWDLCRRYEERGREVIFDATRAGRPRTVSPSGARRNRAVGLL